MEYAGKKKFLNESVQLGQKEVFPEVYISADRVKALKQQKYNSIFSINAVVRIVGIDEKDEETMYRIEVREMQVLSKDEVEMSPEELRDKIEQTVEEKMD